LPLRRTDKTVVDRISSLVGMSAILDYNSAQRSRRRSEAEGTKTSIFPGL